jgi:hypothetical protein
MRAGHLACLFGRARPPASLSFCVGWRTRMKPSERKAESRKALLGVLVPLLKRYGFRKRRFRWYRAKEHVIQVFDVQKSAWSDSYYFNLGVYDLRLGKASWPPIYECHAQLRTTDLQLPPGCRDEALDFTEPVACRDKQVLQTADIGVRWLEQVSTSRGMREYLRSQVSRQHLVMPELRKLYRGKS